MLPQKKAQRYSSKTYLIFMCSFFFIQSLFGISLLCLTVRVYLGCVFMKINIGNKSVIHYEMTHKYHEPREHHS